MGGSAWGEEAASWDSEEMPNASSVFWTSVRAPMVGPVVRGLQLSFILKQEM